MGIVAQIGSAVSGAIAGYVAQQLSSGRGFQPDWERKISDIDSVSIAPAVKPPTSSAWVHATELSFDRLRSAERDQASGEWGPWVSYVRMLFRRDSHLRGLIESLVAGIGRQYTFVAGGTDAASKANAERWNEEFAQMPVTSVLRHMSSAALSGPFGFSATEIMWEREGSSWRAVDLFPVWHELFNVATPYNKWGTDALPDELVLDVGYSKYERLSPFKWIISQPSVGPLAYSPQLAPAAWFSTFKAHAIGAIVQSSDRAGVPYPVVMSGDENPLPQLVAKWREFIQNFGATHGGILNGENVKAEVLTVDDAPMAEQRQRIITLSDNQNSVLILGGTLVAGASDGGSSYALGKTHQTQADSRYGYKGLRLVAEVQDMLIRPWMRLNKLSGAPPIMHLQTVPLYDPETSVKLAKELQKELNIPVSPQQMRLITALKEPTPEEAAAMKSVIDGPSEPDEETKEAA